jgi:hypothetical protein
MDLSRYGKLDIGTLVRNRATSPTATVDSIDMLGGQSGEGGPTAWAVASYMSTLSASHHEESQQRREIESPSAIGRAAALEQLHPPATRANDSFRNQRQRPGDSSLVAAEYMVETGSRSPYSPSARQSHERPAASSHPRPPVSSYHSMSGSSQRSSASISHESRTRLEGITRGPGMQMRFPDAPTSVNVDEMNGKLALRDNIVPSIVEIPERVVTHSEASSPAIITGSKSPSMVAPGEFDSGYSSGCSSHRASQDTFSEASQSYSRGRKHSVPVSSPTAGIRPNTTWTATQNTPKSPLRSGGRAKMKIEKITGHSLEYLNYPIIGNNTQKVLIPQNSKSQLKLEKITGESIESLSYPVVGVVPHWQANSKIKHRLEGRKSLESMAESVGSDFSGEVSLKRSPSWQGSARDSLLLVRPSSSRSTSPERRLSGKEARLSSKQRKKLQKQRQMSKDLTLPSAPILDEVQHAPLLVRSRSQKWLATSPNGASQKQISEDTSKSKQSSVRSSLDLSKNESRIHSLERASDVGQEEKDLARRPSFSLARRPSFFRRRRKREVAPKDGAKELTDVATTDPALCRTPYDTTISVHNRKSLVTLQPLSATLKSPIYSANLPKLVSPEPMVTNRASRPASAPERDHADAVPAPGFARRFLPAPEEGLHSGPGSKSASYDVVASANRGLPRALPAAFNPEQPTVFPVEIDAGLELLPIAPVELPAEVPAELSAEPRFMNIQDHTLMQHTSRTSKRASVNAFYLHHSNPSGHHSIPPQVSTADTRPSSSPATTVGSSLIARPFTTLTSPSPSPPPLAPQSPPRPNSAGSLRNTWKRKHRVPPIDEQETTEWSRQARIWREKNMQAMALTSVPGPLKEASSAAPFVWI